MFRRRLIAVSASLAVTVIPFIFAFVNLMPEAVSRWLLRLTPAAWFAIQAALSAAFRDYAIAGSLASEGMGRRFGRSPGPR